MVFLILTNEKDEHFKCTSFEAEVFSLLLSPE